MKKMDHGLWLRIGFGIFLVIWGLDRVIRAKLWASDSLMGHFYGSIGLMTGFVIALGIVQLLIALSFFTNYQVRCTSLILFAMLIISTFVTIVPLFTYLFKGGNPIPSILFSDHFPLLAGAWAVYVHSRKSSRSTAPKKRRK